MGAGTRGAEPLVGPGLAPGGLPCQDRALLSAALQEETGKWLRPQPCGQQPAVAGHRAPPAPLRSCHIALVSVGTSRWVPKGSIGDAPPLVTPRGG